MPKRARCLVIIVLAVFALGGCRLSPAGSRSPMAAIDAEPASGPAPLAVHFDASRSSDDGAIIAYEWSFDDGAPAQLGERCAYTFRTPGTHQVALSVTDADGNTSSARVDILAENLPPVASFRLSSDAPVLNEWMTVDGSGSYDPAGSEIEFIWAFGDGATAVGPTSGHAYTSEGTYTVTLTVRDPAGAEAVVRHDVLVHKATPGGGCSGGGAVVLF